MTRRLASLLVCAAFTFTAPAFAQAPAPSLNGAPRVERLAQLDNPWGMTFLPDGALLVTEKPGRLRRFENGRLSAPISGVPAVAYRDQGGLLDVAVSPNFATDGLVFLSFSEPAAEQPGGRDVLDTRLGVYQTLEDATVKGLAVARGRLVGDRLTDVRVIWRAPKTVGRGHFGGRLLFAPDGMLLITSGDRQRFEPAQDRNSALGKIHRIRPDGSVPTDNPLSGSVWTMGHRNPLGIAIEPGSGRVWLAEMGPLGGDELNLVERGRNYGWPVVGEGDNYDETVMPRPVTHPEFTPAVHAWTPVISPSSLAIYDGSLFPWRGQLLIGGLSSKALIRVLPRDGGRPDVHAMPLDFRVRDVEQAPDGSIWLLADGAEGGLHRLTPAAR